MGNTDTQFFSKHDTTSKLGHSLGLVRTGSKNSRKTEPTSPKIVDHCNHLKWRNFLSGFTVEDTNVIEIAEVSGYRLLVPGLMHFKIWFPGEYEDFVVSLDVQLNLGWAALSIDTRDAEVIDIGDLCCGDHCQIDHSPCKTGHCV